MSTFTGADLYRAFNAGDKDAVPWSAVSRDIQDLHVCAAAIVHQQHIAPLQELIAALRDSDCDLKAFDEAVFEEDRKKIEALQQLARDWRDYVQADDDLAPDSPHFHEEHDLLKAEWAELKRRTKVLAGEEMKP